ncbi:MAG: hypothetical protein U1F53_11815 [Burkholderiaceae bacterium]
MAAPGPEASPVATSDELRRAALERSARRNAGVARRRLRRRWLGWWLVRLLPLAVMAGLAWRQWPSTGSLAGIKPIHAPAPPAASAQAQSSSPSGDH